MDFQKSGLENKEVGNDLISESSIKVPSKERSFLLSSLNEDNRFQSLSQFLSWFNSRKQVNEFEVRQIPFREMEKWSFNEEKGNLFHDSGRFFSIKGVRISTKTNSWDQPIIDQPEIGILGIITKVFDGTRYFLMQAKMEPGNINIIQLSPTVQATKSNYTRIHGGNLTPYLEYFIDRSKAKILVDQLQTEQGARFMQKRNRNMIVEVSGDIELKEDFAWLTLGEIKKLLTMDNLVNMDSRSVISCIDYVDDDLKEKYSSLGKDRFFDQDGFNKIPDGFKRDLFISMIDKKGAFQTVDEVINWLTNIKSEEEISIKEIPLKEVKKWIRNDLEIKHDEKQFFSVVAVSTKASNREVSSWTQPLIKQRGYGMVGFIAKKINGVLHFLVQARVDPCSFNVIELVPTVACTEAKYKLQTSQTPFLEMFMNPDPSKIKYWSTQSEEGGRFYHSQNSYVVIEIEENKSLSIPKNYTWMTFGQIIELVKHNYFNIDVRGIIACLSFM